MKNVKIYQNKPVTIEAIRWTGDNLREIIDFIGFHPSAEKWTWDEYEEIVKNEGLKIFTLAGSMIVEVGDYIIKAANGNIYPYAAGSFEESYQEPTILEVRKFDENDKWEEFRKSGLLWYINSQLHMFGMAIKIIEDDGEIVDVYPERVPFRGFSEESNTKGYKNVHKFLEKHLSDIIKEDE